MSLSRDDYLHRQEKQKYLEQQQMGNAVAQPSPVLTLLDTLAERQEVLGQMLEELSRRLDPILRPIPPEPVPVPKIDEVSPLVAALAQRVMHVDAHCYRLGDVLKRITL